MTLRNVHARLADIRCEVSGTSPVIKGSRMPRTGVSFPGKCFPNFGTITLGWRASSILPTKCAPKLVSDRNSVRHLDQPRDKRLFQGIAKCVILFSPEMRRVYEHRNHSVDHY